MHEINDSKGFLKDLFDFSFSQFITVKIIKILFGLAIIGAAIWALMILIGGLGSGSVGVALGAIILSPIAFLFSVIISRVYLELILVLFRIAENTQVMANDQKPSSQEDKPSPESSQESDKT